MLLVPVPVPAVARWVAGRVCRCRQPTPRAGWVAWPLPSTAAKAAAQQGKRGQAVCVCGGGGAYGHVAHPAGDRTEMAAPTVNIPT